MLHLGGVCGHAGSKHTRARVCVPAQVRPRGREQFGTKVEIKNMNSFSNMQKAIEFEIERQVGGRRLGVGERGVR